MAPLTAAVIGATETAFQLNNNGLTLAGGGVIPLSAGTTGLYQGTGQVLWIHSAGTLIGGTASSTSLILNLYEIPAAQLPIANTLSGAQTFTTWNKLGTSATGTLAAGVTSGNFTLDAYVQLDASGNLTGYFTAQIFASLTGVSGGATQAATTQIKGLIGETDLNFALTATLGGTTTGVVMTLDEFSLNLE